MSLSLSLRRVADCYDHLEIRLIFAREISFDIANIYKKELQNFACCHHVDICTLSISCVSHFDFHQLDCIDFLLKVKLESFLTMATMSAMGIGLVSCIPALRVFGQSRPVYWRYVELYVVCRVLVGIVSSHPAISLRVSLLIVFALGVQSVIF